MRRTREQHRDLRDGQKAYRGSCITEGRKREGGAKVTCEER